VKWPAFIAVALLAAIVATVIAALLLNGGLKGRPAAAQQPCIDTAKIVTVEFSRTRWPNLTDHIADVRRRYPKVLHISRRDAEANRRAALRGTPTAPGMDRDEEPPAMFAEGGAGASVRLIPSSENRSAGAYMGALLGAYCDGTHVRMTVTP